MIEIKKICKSFNEKLIFQNFSHNIKDNAITAIVGESGIGKSTLLNIIGLLDCEYEGNIIINNINLSKFNLKERIKYIRNNINYLFQNYALIEDETVEKNLLLALEYEKMSKKEKINKINKALDLVGLNGLNFKKVFILSGGEQQRVALARVILKKGDIILADEPTGNLDYENGRKIINILKSMSNKGKTVIVVTHDENIAKECDEIIRLQCE